MKDESRVHTRPPALDEAGLVAFLATQPDVVAAYLFGSLAHGCATPRSDVDIAVLLTRAPVLLAGAPDRQLQQTAADEIWLAAQISCTGRPPWPVLAGQARAGNARWRAKVAFRFGQDQCPLQHRARLHNLAAEF